MLVFKLGKENKAGVSSFRVGKEGKPYNVTYNFQDRGRK